MDLDLDLDLGAVRAFVAVAEDRYFGDAAARLGISQQAVSKRIAKLESDLGTALLRRTPNGAEPTDDGASFLTHARALLALADRSVELVRSRHRALRVGVLGTRIASVETVRAFHETVPDVGIEIVRRDGLADALSALAQGTIDAFFGRALGDLGDVEARPVYLEPIHVLVGREHPFAELGEVSIADLAGRSVWVPGAARPDTEWADFYRAFTAEFGVHIDTSGPNFGLDDLVERTAASRELITGVGEKIRVPWHPGIVQIPVVDPAPVYPWSLLWHPRNRHPVLPMLVSYVRDGFRPYRPDREWLPEPDRPAFTT
ncbi:LysR family transcriptional regulator [Actinomadura algeriensis]|uniref:DNA-binding transcriptional LysR family regulator n=1 Tax=Actinomadura algeriensis TaxID=1679523 RepID=A0ABR9JK72_9ACTN|nr:LysR family transcriptional regulator [Actinomadura algeriensis]MBE1530535.1 DNA-binding transcriptional LysR family regulator [Actinomadura algeriensis]